MFLKPASCIGAIVTCASFFLPTHGQTFDCSEPEITVQDFASSNNLGVNSLGGETGSSGDFSVFERDTGGKGLHFKQASTGMASWYTKMPQCFDAGRFNALQLEVHASVASSILVEVHACDATPNPTNDRHVAVTAYVSTESTLVNIPLPAFEGQGVDLSQVGSLVFYGFAPGVDVYVGRLVLRQNNCGPDATSERCGAAFGNSKCGPGYGKCCSFAGYCGITNEHCNLQTCQSGCGTTGIVVPGEGGSSVTDTAGQTTLTQATTTETQTGIPTIDPSVVYRVDSSAAHSLDYLTDLMKAIVFAWVLQTFL